MIFMSEQLRSELKVIQYYFNKRVDTLESNIKDDLDSFKRDFAEIKSTIDKYLSHCDVSMEKHDSRIRKIELRFEAFKNRVLGAASIVAFIVTILVAVWAILR